MTNWATRLRLYENFAVVIDIFGCGHSYKRIRRIITTYVGGQVTCPTCKASTTITDQRVEK